MVVLQSVSNESIAGHGQLLLGLARRSIEHGLSAGTPPMVPLEAIPADLQRHGATFVTLYRHGQLRGCIGNLEACQPLVCDVVQNAFSAAYSDPRFPRVEADELATLQLEISVLTPRQPVTFDSESRLLETLRPRVDGVVLEEGGHRATFLPAVWEQLPEPASFLRQLKLKAGLAPDYWSPTLKVYRYQTVSLCERSRKP